MYFYEDEGEPYIPPTPKRRASANVGRDATFYERPTAMIMRPPPPRRSHHFLFWFGLGMLLCLGVWYVWVWVITPWVHGIEMRWEYGTNHLSLFGADVGHGGVSRFVAFEDGNDIVIVEVVKKKYAVYTIPVSNADHRVVTLSVQDVNHDGKLDLVVHVDGVYGAFALLNTGSAFSWSQS